MKVGFTGPQCSGKSTLLQKCKEYYGDKFEYVDEVTRPLAREGFEINEGGNDATQKAIIDAHIANITKKNVIMDRCIVDGMAYSFYFLERGQISLETWNYCVTEGLRKCLREMDIIFMTESVKMEDDGVRSTNEDFRNRIEEIFDIYKSIFKYVDPYWSPGKGIKFTGKFIYLTGDVEKRFNDITIAIEEYERNTR